MKFEEALNEIIKTNFIFQEPNTSYYSEAGIQYKIAIEIYKKLNVESILEYKIRGRKEYLDIFCKYNKTRFGIELKYKTIKVESINFDYVSQGAQNNGKYDFLRDISRIECFICSKIIDIGYVIFITNDKSYYTSARKNSSVSKFDLINTTKKKYHPEWKGRKNDIKIRGKYSITWQSPEIVNNNAVPFNYCIVKINNQD